VSLRPAYLIAGSDWPKVDAAASRLRAHFPEEAVEQITVGEAGSGEILAACNSLGLLGGDRLVLVRGAERLEAADVEAIAGYLRDPAPGTCLALFGGSGITDKDALAKAVAKVGDVRLFDAPDRATAVAWVVKRFSDGGLRCPTPVAKRLVELAGADIGDLALEVEKVATLCRDRPPELDDVEAVVARSHDIKPWDITDAWGRRDAAAVIALATADVERPEDVHRLLGSLSAHVRKVRRALVLLEQGAAQADVARELGVKPYPARRLCDQARAFDQAELAAAVIRLAQLDEAVKGGSRLDPRLELELALADITGS
jgi:DNA polymerase III subunit delta